MLQKQGVLCHYLLDVYFTFTKKINMFVFVFQNVCSQVSITWMQDDGCRIKDISQILRSRILSKTTDKVEGAKVNTGNMLSIEADSKDHQANFEKS